MVTKEQALDIHEKLHGKISIAGKSKVKNGTDLSLVYTPGVAFPCMEIYNNRNDVFRYTAKGNLVAIVTDGSAVLGLGNIGPEAALPVMEGKALLFKEFAGIDAFPICLDTQDSNEIINTVKYIAPVFGGINLEDIAAPRCFEIEQRLRQELNIPVFHDDQHGTAIIVTAGLINALKLTGRQFADTRFVVNGPGAAGTAITKMLILLGAKDIVVCNLNGILDQTDASLYPHEIELAQITNPRAITGDLNDAMKNADVLIGVSASDVVSSDMVRSMNPDAIIFALANPKPEIMPDLARQAGARIIATGRSDFPNQINNVLAFPGIFRGALDARVEQITDDMKIAAAYAIASLIGKDELREDNIIPDAFNPQVVSVVARAVAEAARCNQ